MIRCWQSKARRSGAASQKPLYHRSVVVVIETKMLVVRTEFRTKCDGYDLRILDLQNLDSTRHIKCILQIPLICYGAESSKTPQSPCSPFDPCGEHWIWFEYTDVDILDVDDDANVDECYIIDYNERKIFHWHSELQTDA